ncbi:MAG TPA: DUF4142 domain-containing protein [Bacteroidia bacterium]|nr:DUF4142 domain-containing protein [Bacteroidia bacterium]
MKRLLFTSMAAVALSFTEIATVKKTDDQFIVMAGSKGLFELKLGELAKVNGSSPAIRMLGELMVKDHEKSNSELKALALRRGVTLPATLDGKQQKRYTKLFEKKGKAFDEAYAWCMVRDHKEAISEFKKEAKNGTDPAVKNWASATLSSLENHLQMSIETCKTVRYEK